MKNLQRVSELLGTENGQKAFLAWAGSEMTQHLLAAARELAAPKPPINYSPCAVAVALGEARGADAVVSYLTEPWKASSTSDEDLTTPTYGADSILKEEYGYDDSE